ncbi:hypothetical protein B0T20DRAFT_425816 [Sordaria brevicollis]|uniref:MYND-type domain-containing protein n=1 Tax=Sordaria brevicollis TaxID=83679 RepID=A0AAE0U2H2_SORBR|nr:hypothetical protein B0T20DRAFT_425816 [Sordaria brevicollis]
MKLEEESRSQMRKREIDITVSHEDNYVVARNVLVLSLILDLNEKEAGEKGTTSEEQSTTETTTNERGEKTTTTKQQTAQRETLRRIWNIYYSHFLHDSETRRLLAQQSTKLVALSATIFSWAQGPYGSALHFINQKSLDAVRDVWAHFAWAATIEPRPDQEKEKIAKLQEYVKKCMKPSSPDEKRSWLSGSSTAPLTTLLRDKIHNVVNCDWELDEFFAEDHFGNPMFAWALVPDVSGGQVRCGRRIAYPSNGVVGYHLALNNKVPLEELSPLRIDSLDATTKDSYDQDRDIDGNVTALTVAKHQFAQWSLAFLELASARPGRLKISFAVDGWFTLCQSLVKEKKQFDVIDTTDLDVSPFSTSNAFWSPFSAGVADPPGILGLFVAAKQLLKDRASSTLVIDDGEGESSLAADASQTQPDPSKPKSINATSMFLLGLAAVEYWTNASVRSTLDDCLDVVATRFYDDNHDKGEGLVRDKSKDAEAAAVRVKRMEDEGRLQIPNRLYVKHSRWLVNRGQNGVTLSKRLEVFAGAEELMGVAWKTFQDLVVLKVEGQKVKHQGQELIKVSWGEGLWQTLLDFLKVVVRQFQVETVDDGEHLRRVILDRIGGNETQDRLLREALDLERSVSKGTTLAEAEVDDNGSGPVLTANFDVASGTLNTITAYLDFVSEEDKRFLADKSIPIRLVKVSPWAMDIVFGNYKLVKQLIFPTPVAKEGSKTRIARTSGYIEVIARVVPDVQIPETAHLLDDYIFLTVLQPAADDDSSAERGQLIPATLNCPTVNLDSLPILSITDTSPLKPFLPGLTASVFSPREIGIRMSESEDRWPARMQLKESLHLMANLVTGLQGGHQSGLFELHTPYGLHMLIVVSAIRLDCSAQGGGSIILDAAVLPYTEALAAEAKRQASDENDDFNLATFLMILKKLAAINLDVTDTELVLWKFLIAASAERCRTYSHLPSCEYTVTGEIPLSIKKGGPVLCSCGLGHFPPDYLSLPLWNVAQKYSTRVAISLPYPSPIAEPAVFDPNQARQIAERGLVVKKQEERCRACGKSEEQLIKEAKERGGETANTENVLKKCLRCLKVRYCGAECQRRDWKTHKMECRESEEYENGESERSR